MSKIYELKIALVCHNYLKLLKYFSIKPRIIEIIRELSLVTKER